MTNSEYALNDILRAYGLDRPVVGVDSYIDCLIWRVPLAVELQRHSDLIENFYPTVHHGCIDFVAGSEDGKREGKLVITFVPVSKEGVEITRNIDRIRIMPEHEAMSIEDAILHLKRHIPRGSGA